MQQRVADFETDCSLKELYPASATQKQRNNNKDDDASSLIDVTDVTDSDLSNDSNMGASSSKRRSRGSKSSKSSKSSKRRSKSRSVSSSSLSSALDNIGLDLDPSLTHASDTDDETVRNLTDDAAIQEHLKKKYASSFYYQRELAKILNEHPEAADLKKAVANLNLIKSGSHPRQWVIQQQRRETVGETFTAQLKSDLKISHYKQHLLQKSKKTVVPSDNEVEPCYPPWLKFNVRFRKRSAERKWNEHVESLKDAKNSKSGKVPKVEKYAEENLDIWTNSVTSFVKPGANLQHIVAPVLAKIGLEWRIDLKYTVGSFVGDRRSSGKEKSEVQEAIEILPYTSANDLYERNVQNIFVNDNKLAVHANYPQLYSPHAADTDAEAPAASDATVQSNTTFISASSTPTNQSSSHSNQSNSITYVRVASKKRPKRIGLVLPKRVDGAAESWTASTLAASLHSLPEIAKALD